MSIDATVPTSAEAPRTLTMSDEVKYPTGEELEREYHAGRATLPVNRINHREFVKDGIRYFVGWSSEGVTRYSEEHGYNVRDVVGWFTYKAEPVTDGDPA